MVWSQPFCCLQQGTPLPVPLHLAGDPAAALQDLHRSMALSQQLGETTGDADTLGELADMYAELGDLETAGRFYGAPASVALAFQGIHAVVGLRSRGP